MARSNRQKRKSQFKLGDLIQHNSNMKYGLVLDARPTQLVVAWQDSEEAWDVDPAEVHRLAHIPMAVLLTRRREELERQWFAKQQANLEKLLQSQ